MNDRWLPIRAVLNGFVVGIVAFMTLHLTIGASLPATIAMTLAGAVAVTLIVCYLRRTELMRTTQAQGYFTSALIVSALAIVMLPQNYVVNALTDPSTTAQVDTGEIPRGAFSDLYPDASAAVTVLLNRAKQDYALADTSIYAVIVGSSTVSISVFDPTADVVRNYAIDRAGTVYLPSISNVDPDAIYPFGWTSINVPDLNKLYLAFAGEYKMTTSGVDDITITAPSKGAPPQIALGYGPPAQRQWIYAQNNGTYLNGP